jgi:hypothetical protein
MGVYLVFTPTEADEPGCAAHLRTVVVASDQIKARVEYCSQLSGIGISIPVLILFRCGDLVCKCNSVVY